MRSLADYSPIVSATAVLCACLGWIAWGSTPRLLAVASTQATLPGELLGEPIEALAFARPQVRRVAMIDRGQAYDVTAPATGRIVATGSIKARVGASDHFGRALRPGDRVAKGQVLLVLGGNEIGEIKHRFLAAVSRLLFDEASLARLTDGNASEAAVGEARRHCQSDRARVERCEQALHDLGVSRDEIESIRTSADEVHQGRPDYSQAAQWEELELRARGPGVVCEIHAATGDRVSEGTVVMRIAESNPAAPDGGASDLEQRLAESIVPERIGD